VSYLISILAIVTGIVLVCLACPTAGERANTVDKIGRTTGINWR
jgi:hypothetical protein